MRTRFLILGTVHDMAARRPRTGSTSISSPVGGLNARDSIADMPETDALVLDNWFPGTTEVDVRNGSLYFADCGSHAIETLMGYVGPVTKKLFAVSSDGIYNITAGGHIASADISPITNARWQHVNFGTPGGNFLLSVNGADKLRGYNGTAWWADGDGSHDITGVDSANLIGVNIFKSRLWFTEKNTAKAWYLPINSIAGVAVSFDFTGLFYLGGYLMGITTWTVDNAAGLQEYLVAVSSEGEVLVYQGYDPSSSSTFSLAAHFRIGRPVGRRFYAKSGSDVVLLTVDGVVPLSQALLTDRSAVNIALSDKIINSISVDIANYNANFGWQIILHPVGSKLIVNVPQSENTRQYQYVMNTINKSWCTFGQQLSFSAWNANCFELFSDKLYYGSNNKYIFQADVGTQDAFDSTTMSNITSIATPAFSYFKSKGQEKLFGMARPILKINGTIQVALSFNVDFNTSTPNLNYATVSTSTSAPWDTSPWDTTAWGGDSQILKDWQTLNGIGFAGSLSIGAITSLSLGWQSTDYTYQLGGVL